jgi:hypothetical protein
VQLKRYGIWLGLGPTLGAVLACSVVLLFTPRLRVLNLGSSTLRIFVDGKERLSLPPTSAESPLAGAELRLGAGFRQLEARTSTGTVVSPVGAKLLAGRRHLYAPGAEGTCFWLETTSYGRSGASVERDPLSGEQHFWLLPRNIDLWFSEAPEVPDPSRSSGGRITALRQGPCNAVTVSGQE